MGNQPLLHYKKGDWPPVPARSRLKVRPHHSSPLELTSIKRKPLRDITDP